VYKATFMTISKRLAMLKAKGRAVLSYQVKDSVKEDLSFLYGDSLMTAIKSNKITAVCLQDDGVWYEVTTESTGK
jgi:hypothetical protein